MQPEWACPGCRSPLVSVREDELKCLADDLTFAQVGGVWRFLLPERQPHFEAFARDYETIRRAEGRWNDDPAYFRALPFKDLSGQRPADWRIRAASYRAFVRRVVQPREAQGSALSIADLGAGNGWLSHQLARRGHGVVAVDLLVNDWDGLGAGRHYSVAFAAAQAEFERLPLADGQLDLAVFNASFHYSEDYQAALSEALRCLKPEGTIVILDTPLYDTPASGVQMVSERQREFEARYGLRSDSLRSENFLTPSRLGELARALGLAWRQYPVYYGLGWALRPLAARLRGRRQPARFCVLEGVRAGA